MSLDATAVLDGITKIYAKVYVGSADNPVASNAIDWTGWDQVSYLADGEDVVIEHGQEMRQKRCENILYPLGLTETARHFKVTVPIAQSALVTMPRGWGGAVYAAGATPGTNENSLLLAGEGLQSYLTFGIEGESQDLAAGWVLWLPKVKITTEPVSQNFGKRQNRSFSIVVEAVYDPAQNSGEEVANLYEITVA